jgi:hypothetical protein
MRFKVVSDRSYTLNSRKQADLSDTKLPLGHTAYYLDTGAAATAIGRVYVLTRVAGGSCVFNGQYQLWFSA